MTDPTTPQRKRAATVTRRYGGLDAAERRRERQRKLIDAGLEVFGTRGYHLSTVRDLCAEAGLTERYFYESFKTVGELFDAVYADLRGQLQQRIMAAVIQQGVQATNALGLGESTLRAWYKFLQDDPRAARIMLIDAVSVSDNGMRGAEAAINEFAGMYRTFVSMLYPDLPSAGFDMDLVVAGLTGTAIYIAKHWVRSGFKQPLEDVLNHNMAIYKSLDRIYHQSHEAQAQAQAQVDEQAALSPRSASSRSRRRAGA